MAIKLALLALFFAALPALASGNLEVPAPGSTQSGVDAISGWHCTASKIEITIDDCGRGGSTIVRYDNETPKGDHRHVGPSETQNNYRFVSLRKLLSDFARDIEALSGEIK